MKWDTDDVIIRRSKASFVAHQFNAAKSRVGVGAWDRGLPLVRRASRKRVSAPPVSSPPCDGDGTKAINPTHSLDQPDTLCP